MTDPQLLTDECKEANQLHSDGLKSLLEKLEKEDTLFKHNVPESIISLYSETELIQYLDRVYSQPEFIVESEKTINDHAKEGCKVIAKKDIELSKLLSPIKGDTGFVEENTSCESVYVKFRDLSINRKDKVRSVHKSDLVVYGRKIMGVSKTFKESKPATAYKKLKKNMLMEYVGENRKHLLKFIPKNTEGIIMRKGYGWNVVIAWRKNKTVKLQYNSLAALQHGDKYADSFDNLKLLIKNEVPYRKLKHTCLTDNKLTA